MIRSKQLAVTDGVDELARALAAGIAGEVRFDAGTRAIYAHDASNYRQPPIGVVLPRRIADVEHAHRTCRAHDVPLLSRGGGTSLAGQCVNRAVVIDFSKYMHRVLAIDPDRRRVRVQPGCVLDTMRDALAPHDLTYGPDPATHSHCTLGGMLGNNSCGVHSVMGELHGSGPRTSDHVESLEVLTYDGLRLDVGATPPAELERRCRVPGRAGEIYRALARLADEYADEIRRRFAPIPRRVSGYNLEELLPERGFHVARALVGSEATCVTILEATLEVYPSPLFRSLIVLGFPDVFAAGDAVVRVRAHSPIGVEGMDDELVRDVGHLRSHDAALAMLPAGGGWLLVELGGNSQAEVDARVRALVTEMAAQRRAPTMRVFRDSREAQQIWEVRESGLAATAFVAGQGDAWPGWEDSAVPPDRLGDYLRELRALLDRHGYACALYGHFGQGCVHTRIDFDLATPAGIERYRRFTDAAADLVVRYGGSISGEHGDGQARADLLERQFGPRLVEAFRAFKRIWDPANRMNPNKLVAGVRTDDLKLATYHPPEPATAFRPPEDGGDFRHAAIRCVGVGKCRRDTGGTMCPSFMVTHEEMHTTRGRARILFEMLHGGVIEDGWASEAVHEALDLCLACKGCKGDCPVNVDIATYKAEFLSHYYEHHRRPRHAYALGWIDRWARIASRLPGLVNLVTQTPVLRRLAAAIGGIAPERPIPRFAATPFTRAPQPPAAGAPVVLWADTFNNHFLPRTLAAASYVLRAAGCAPIVPRGDLCCGRALYDHGMLDLARRKWRRTLDALAPHVGAETPIVVLEPSCAAAFRDELPSLMHDDPSAPRLAALVQTLPELLARRGFEPPRVQASALLHGHCHHKAVLDFTAERRLVAAMGFDVVEPDAGCCGLAGGFGFERAHYELAMAIGERVLLPAARELAVDVVITDGFSCREQLRHGADRAAFHVAEVLARVLHEARQRRRPVPRPATGERVAADAAPR